MPKELTSGLVQQWITLASGQFTSRQIRDDLQVISPEGKNNLRQILYRLADAGVIARTGQDGTYRKVDTEREVIDWESADPDNVLPIVLPFGIHEVCKLYPKSIVVVAGSKNEGKTAFLMSCIKPNMDKFVIDYYNSETGPEQLKERLSAMDFPSPAPFNSWRKYDNFGDVIESNHLSIIDYLDMQSEVYLVGAEIERIFRKVDCCAIIGIQKPPPSVTYVKGVKHIIDRDLGYGGAFSAKRAVLYITMSSHKLKLVYVKTPANPLINPNNMQWSYGFDETGYFTNIQRYYEYEEM